MSSSSKQFPSISPEDAASREDLELFQRLVRVARLLKNHDADDLWNQTPSLNRTSHNNGTDGNTLRGIEQAAGTDMNYDDYDDDNDDFEEDDDDDYIEDAEEVREGSTNAAASFNQPITPSSIKSSQPSRRKQPSKHQDGDEVAPKRRRLRQRPDQQQQQQDRKQGQQHQRPHAAVEKRYRSVVNSKIQQLRATIPPSITFSPNNASTPSDNQGAQAVQEMPTKSIVLDRATQYINHLVATYGQYETERTELRRRLQSSLDNMAPMEKQVHNQMST